MPLLLVSLLRRRCVRHAVRAFAVLAMVSSVANPLFAGPPVWTPVAPSELAEAQPRLDSEAPAEILQWKCEVDDRYFPDSRTKTLYVRMKVYAPEKFSDISQVSNHDMSESSEIHARLTLPNGTVKEFGPESVREHAAARSGRTSGFFSFLTNGSWERKGKTIAITGIEPGSILEYHFVDKETWPSRSYQVALQHGLLPVRRAEYTCRIPNLGHEVGRNLILHRLNGELKEDKKERIVTFSAVDLPPIQRERYLGPVSDYQMTIVTYYERAMSRLIPRSGVKLPANIKANEGPWVFESTMWNWYERDRGFPTKKVKALAQTLITGAKDDLAKATAIHNYTRKHYQDRRKLSQTKKLTYRGFPDDLDELILDKDPPEKLFDSMEYLWLGLALYKAAGFDAHLVLVPNRSVCRFSEEIVFSGLLPELAIAVPINGSYQFSAPHLIIPRAFGMLPWFWMGQKGLLALDHQQKFIPVPALPASASVARQTGTFSLDAAGTLSGDIELSMTGYQAFKRNELCEANAPRRIELAREALDFNTDIVALTNVRIENLEDVDAPLIIRAHLRWPGFAVRTKDRLFIQPGELWYGTNPQFPGEKRKYPISLTNRSLEQNRFSIQLPPGFVLETAEPAAPLDAKVLSHRLQVSFDNAANTLHLDREFRSDILEAPVSAYGALKTWYDAAAEIDNRDIVLVGKDLPSADLYAAAPPVRDEEIKPATLTPAPAKLKKGASGLPEWAEPLLARDVKSLAEHHDSVILADLGSVAYQPDGRARKRYRGALRVLTYDGKSDASCRLGYNADTEKLLNVKAWLITAEGKIDTQYIAKDFLDGLRYPDGAVFWPQARELWLRVTSDIEVNGALVWEFEVETQPEIFDDTWDFPTTEPTLLCAFEVTPAPGGNLEWRGTSDRLPAPVAGSSPGSLVWQQTDYLPPARKNFPDGFIWNPRRVSVHPVFADGRGANRSWNDLARVASDLMEPKVQATSAELKAKALELTASCKDRWQRIRALTAFVQKHVNYFQVTLDRDPLVGYRPHAAQDVFANRFGDCKDKATLLIAMLRAIGDDGKGVLVLSGNPMGVVADWAAPQFNHMIVGIAADPEVPENWPVADAGPLGKLVLFDPTDRYTPLGVLPHADAGGRGLVVCQQAADLIAIPPGAVENTTDVELSIESEGDVRFSVHRIARGRSAAERFAERDAQTKTAFTRSLESDLHDSVPFLEDLKWSDQWHPEKGEWGVKCDFIGRHYASRTGDLLLVKPCMRDWATRTPWKTEHEGAPWMSGGTTRMNTRLVIPDGYVLAETPEDWSGEVARAAAQARYRREGRVLVCEFEFRQTPGVADREQYEGLANLLRKLEIASRRPVLLKPAASVAKVTP